jgi:hypothetical protein
MAFKVSIFITLKKITMADFIELSQIYETKDGYLDTTPKIFNKALITGIEEDRRHDQTYITYQGEEFKVKETLEEINAKSSE